MKQQLNQGRRAGVVLATVKIGGIFLFAILLIQTRTFGGNIVCYDIANDTSGGGSTPTCAGVQIPQQCQAIVGGNHEGDPDVNGGYKNPTPCGQETVFTFGMPPWKTESCGVWNIVEPKASGDQCCPPSS